MKKDHAALAIVIANLLTVALAWWQHWPLAWMLWPYWVQSVVIGWYARKRILALTKFSTEGFRINDRAVDPTPETRQRTANFFALHYGFFHLIYFVFLLAGAAMPGAEAARTSPGQLRPLDLVLGLGLALSFVFTHRASHREHLAADLRRTPNIGTLMFVPYLRVIPMHLTILFGMTLGAGLGVLLFGALKTSADVLMHLIEHRWLQGRGATAPASRSVE